jgi:hypothetical protein
MTLIRFMESTDDKNRPSIDFYVGEELKKKTYNIEKLRVSIFMCALYERSLEGLCNGCHIVDILCIFENWPVLGQSNLRLTPVVDTDWSKLITI